MRPDAAPVFKLAIMRLNTVCDRDWAFDGLYDIGNADRCCWPRQLQSAAYAANRTQQTCLAEDADKLLNGREWEACFLRQFTRGYAPTATMARSCAHGHNGVICKV